MASFVAHLPVGDMVSGMLTPGWHQPMLHAVIWDYRAMSIRRRQASTEYRMAMEFNPSVSAIALQTAFHPQRGGSQH